MYPLLFSSLLVRRSIGSILAAGPDVLELRIAVVCEVRKGGVFGVATLDLAEAVEARVGVQLNSLTFTATLAILRLCRQIGRRRGRQDGWPVSLWYSTSGTPLRRGPNTLPYDGRLAALPA